MFWLECVCRCTYPLNLDQGLFRESPKNLFDLKSRLWNSNPLVLKADLLTSFQYTINQAIAKFDCLEPWHCEDIKGIGAPKIGMKSFGTGEGKGCGQLRCYELELGKLPLWLQIKRLLCFSVSVIFFLARGHAVFHGGCTKYSTLIYQSILADCCFRQCRVMKQLPLGFWPETRLLSGTLYS